MRQPIRSILAGVLLLGLLGPRAIRAQTPDEAGVRYSVEVTGSPSSAVSSLIEESSQLEKLRDRLPATAAALARRIREDEDQFHAILESEGYYAGRVRSRTEPRGTDFHVQVTIEPGTQYTVGDFRLDYGDRHETVATLEAKASPATAIRDLIGKAARADNVINAEDAAINLLREHGFPFARRGDRQVTVDHATHTIAVVLPVSVGRTAHFGETHFQGQARLKPAYLQSLVPWKHGETFNTRQLDRFRQSLVRTALFSTVKVTPADDEKAPDGAPLDVLVDLKEGPSRTFGATANYNRDTGFGGSVFWEHRNLLGKAEILNLSAEGSELTQTVKAALTRPNWKRMDQTLRFASILQRSTTDAFDGQSARLEAGLERRVSAHWTIGAGTSAEIARLIEHGVRRRSLLGGIPLTATRYLSDDITEKSVIDASSGWRAAFTVTPYGGTYIDKVFFVRAEAEGEVYVPLNQARTTVIAARLKLGSIAGSATDRIPADRRFYSGGGGSIRGFGYQLVSPLSPDGKPIGGRSVIETSLEARFRITRTIGLVPFVDAGSVSNSSIPGKDVSVRVAAGLGLRYYTGVGPLRVDFAMPLNKREGIDNPFQFYISFGQAF